jgi:hypothetical protein
MSAMDYELRYPGNFDDEEYDISSKGWFDQFFIETPARTFRPTFFRDRSGELILRAASDAIPLGLIPIVAQIAEDNV